MTLARRSKSRTARAKRTAEQKARTIVRTRALHFNSGMCEICGLHMATDWAHRVARSQGGEWRASNGLAACSPCHQAQRDNKGGGPLARSLGQVLSGMTAGEKTDPSTIPVQTVYGRVLLDDHGGWRPV